MIARRHFPVYPDGQSPCWVCGQAWPCPTEQDDRVRVAEELAQLPVEERERRERGYWEC